MVAVLPEAVDLPLRLKPWMSKVAEMQQEGIRQVRGVEVTREKEAIFFKYLPRNRSNGSSRYTFLVTNLSKVWIEVLSHSAFTDRYGEYLSESLPRGRGGSSGADEMDSRVRGTESGEAQVERMFDPRFAGAEGGWDGFELEVEGEESAETFELRSEDLFWQIKARQLSAAQAIIILRDHFVIPMMGVLGAYGHLKMTDDLEDLTKAIDTTSIPASKARLPQLLAATTDHPRTQTSLRRWNQGWQGMKDKKASGKGLMLGGDGEQMVEIVEGYDEADLSVDLQESTPPAQESIPPPAMAQRQRTRSPSALQAVPPHADQPCRGEELPPGHATGSTSPHAVAPADESYDSDATEPGEDNAPAGQSYLSLPKTIVASSLPLPTSPFAPLEEDDVDSDGTDDDNNMDPSQQPRSHATRHHGHMVVERESDESQAGRVSLERVGQELRTVSRLDASSSSVPPPLRANKRKADPPSAAPQPDKRVALGSGTGSSKGMVSRTAGKKKSVW